MNSKKPTANTIRDQAMAPEGLRRKYLKYPLYLSLVFTVLIAGGWIAASIIFPSKKIVGIVQSQLADKTGLNFNIESAGIQFPPGLRLSNVRLDSNKSPLSIEKIVIYPRILSLLQGEIEIDKVVIYSVNVRLQLRRNTIVPPAWMQKIKQAPSGGNDLPVSSIACRDCHVEIQSDQESFAGAGNFRFGWDTDIELAQNSIQTDFDIKPKPGAQEQGSAGGELSLQIKMESRPNQVPLVLRSKNEILESIASVHLKLDDFGWLPVRLKKHTGNISGELAGTRIKNSAAWKITTLNFESVQGWALSGGGEGQWQNKKVVLSSKILALNYNKYRIAKIKSLEIGRVLGVHLELDTPLSAFSFILGNMPRSGVVKGTAYIHNSALKSARLFIQTDQARIAESVSLLPVKTNVIIKNGIMSRLVLPIRIREVPATLTAQGKVTSIKDLSLQLSFHRLDTSFLNGRKSKSGSSFVLPPVSLQVDRFYLTDETFVSNLRAVYRQSNEGRSLQNLRLDFAGTEIVSSWRESDGFHNIAFRFSGAKPAAINGLPFSTWFGTLNGSGNLRFPAGENLRADLTGQLELSGSRGRLMNTFLQKGFLSGPLGGLESRIIDLEYLGFMVRLNIKNGNFGIENGKFSGPDWQLRLLGSINAKNRGDLHATLRVEQSFLSEIAHPAWLALQDKKRGDRYVFDFICRGEPTSPSCWQYQD